MEVIAQPETPLMRQYAEIKQQHQDAILLFRLGDFYEMFYEDAQVASKILDIALTSRDKNAENPVPLCGVPHHSVGGYISTLLDKGHKVAICEQVEDPKIAKGIVRREVVRVITPGLQTDLEGLGPTEVNALVSLFWAGQDIALAWMDVASGDFRTTRFTSFSDAEDELWRLAPREILVPEEGVGELISSLISRFQLQHPQLRVERVPVWVYEKAERRLCERFSVQNLDGFGLPSGTAVIPAAAAVIHYIEEKNKTRLAHLAPPKFYSTADCVHLDLATRENLELFAARGNDRARSLWGVLDHTQSAMGSRKLREWLSFPLTNVEEINTRLDAVEYLKEQAVARDGLRKRLSEVYDLERLIGRLAGNRANARDLVALRDTLLMVPAVRAILVSTPSALLRTIRDSLDPHLELVSLLERALNDNPPPGVKDGGMIRTGFHAELDELRSTMTRGRQWVAELELRERERTGIHSLKVGYNRVFGYFIEVTKANLSKVPSDFLRKQTLSNGERYVTPELKEQEARILGAEERVASVEAAIFEDLQKRALEHARTLQRLAEELARLDVLCSLAQAATLYRYARPVVSDSDVLRITAGRHPVVERFLTDSPFVPNSIELNGQDRQMIILTGPNMAGKSTIMRQIGLITLLAQVGSFVSAEAAEVGVVDRIFTRVGASDNLVRGQSTFMVEMSETANILRNATKRSLVLLDEIGRGTSTFDGLSIAWAVAEDLHDRVGARTLFATHYHELTDLGRTKDRVKNMNVAVREWEDQIVFLRTLAEGAVNRSYGIEVARLAGVPQAVVDRAKEILGNLERHELDATGKPAFSETRKSGSTQKPQLDLFRRMADELWEEFKKLDPESLTPRQALDHFYAWRDRFRSK